MCHVKQAGTFCLVFYVLFQIAFFFQSSNISALRYLNSLYFTYARHRFVYLPQEVLDKVPVMSFIVIQFVWCQAGIMFLKLYLTLF
jgi:hypothetical protein